MSGKDRISQQLAESLEDEHLEYMLRLACRRKEAQDVQQLLDETENDEHLQQMRDRCYARFEEKLNASRRQEGRSAHCNKYCYKLRRCGHIAACLLLAVCIGAPIALANSPILRSKVMQLLVSLGGDHTNLRLANVAEESIVPDGWNGSYYPSYIPEGYTLEFVGKDNSMVTYKNAEGAMLKYRENGGNVRLNVDDETTPVTYASVHGEQAIIAERDGRTSIAWSANDIVFAVYADLPTDELIRIAESIRPAK